MASNESAVLFDQPGPKGRKTIRIVNWIAGIIFAVVVVLILMRLHNPPDGENQLSWELWKPALDAEAWTDFYLPGLWATIRASVLAVVGAVVFGLVFGVGRLLPSLLIRTISGAIVEFARAVPVLLLMIFFWRWFAFAGLPSPAYWAVVLALVIYNGSVVAELVRSGVGNLPNGQREASLALGLTRTQSLLQIEVPQAIYAMLPAAVTQLVVVCWLLSRLAEWLPSRMQQHTAAPAEPEPVAPIAIMDPSNVNQIAVAKEGVPLGGAQRVYHVHHRGTNASIHQWRQTRYAQGFDETHPESQIKFDKNGHPIKDNPFKTKGDGKDKNKSEADE